MIIWFLFFSLLVWCITLICRCWKILESLDKSHLIKVYEPFNVGIMFASIVLRIFASKSISDIGLQFSFFYIFLSGFGVRVIFHRISLGAFLPVRFFWNSFRNIGVNSHLNICQISLVRPFCDKLFLLGVLFFEIINSISLLVIGPFIFFTSSWFSLERFYIPRNFPISSRLSI